MISIPGYEIKKRIDDQELYSIFRGIRDKGQKPVRIVFFNLSSIPKEKILSLKQKLQKIRSSNLDCTANVLEVIDHPNRIIQVLEDYEGVPLADVIRETQNDNNPLCPHLLRGNAKGESTYEEGTTNLSPPEEGGVKTFLQIAIEITDAVGALHQNNIIHESISPFGIQVNLKSKKVKFTEFGFELFADPESNAISTSIIRKRLLPYISPEQTGRTGHEIDYRSDFYSLGILLYEILTGQPPFKSHDPQELFYHHVAIAPKTPKEMNNIGPRTHL